MESTLPTPSNAFFRIPPLSLLFLPCKRVGSSFLSHGPWLCPAYMYAGITCVPHHSHSVCMYVLFHSSYFLGFFWLFLPAHVYCTNVLSLSSSTREAFFESIPVQGVSYAEYVRRCMVTIYKTARFSYHI